MADEFVAIDLETANPQLSSICQIGIVTFRGGAEVDAWDSLVDPEDYFDPMNFSVHGIDPDDVEGKPTWPELASEVHRRLAGRVVVCHTAFDRIALSRACERYQTDDLNCRWIDSARVARRTWEQFAHRGYGLLPLAEFCGFKFEHHDAVEDARAAGRVFLRAVHDSSRSVDEWSSFQFQRKHSSVVTRQRDPVTRQGDPDGPLAGEVMVFTGALTLPRSQAADLAASAGADVRSGVSKKTTLLVVGDQDVSKLVGRDKSSKHRKAEKLIESGIRIRVLSESDFRQLLEVSQSEA